MGVSSSSARSRPVLAGPWAAPHRGATTPTIGHEPVGRVRPSFTDRHNGYRGLVTNEQLAVVVPILAASISFVAAVVAVVVGQLLGQRFTRSADERRWKREDAARRRLRGEEAALEARKALRKASSLFEAGWMAARYQSSRWEPPADEAVMDLTDHAQDLAIDIPDDDVQLFIRHAADALSSADAANQGGAAPPWVIAQSVAAEVDAVIGAYRRGAPIPPAPETDAAVLAAGEWWAEITRIEAEHRESERRVRVKADRPQADVR
jgi:hypothetical protein